MAKATVDAAVRKRLADRLATGIPTPLGDLMRQAQQRLVTTLDGALHDAGWDDVRSPHVSVLATVHPNGSRLTALTERGGRTKQSVAELVAHLIEHEYLLIEPDPTDRRAKLYSPTPRAFVLLAACEKVVDDYETWLERTVGNAAVAKMRRTLQTIIDAPP